MTDPFSQQTKKERRETARAERIAAEQDAAGAAARKKRLGIFVGLLVAALAVVGIAIAASSVGDDKKSSASGLNDVDNVLALYKGIPQDGITLGDPKAKATIVLFADAQCPYCRDFELSELEGIVNKSIRPGKAKMVLRLRAFLGDDSVTAANAIYGSAAQNKAFTALGILYHNQGEENTGWVTDEKLREILGAVPGLSVDKALKAAEGDDPARLLAEADTLAGRYGSQSTPEVYVGKSENDASKVGATEADVNKAVDEIAK